MFAEKIITFLMDKKSITKCEVKVRSRIRREAIPSSLAHRSRKLIHSLQTYVTRSEKTYNFPQKLKKRYKQKSRKKSFFNPKLFLAYLRFQLLGYLLAKFQHLKHYSFAKRAAQRELLLFSSRGRLYVSGN